MIPLVTHISSMNLKNKLFNKIHKGDIRIATVNEHLARHVLVLDTFEYHSKVAMLHSFTEYSTTNDLIIPANVSNLKYDLVLHNNFVGVVFNSQIEKFVTTLTLDIVEWFYDFTKKPQQCYNGYHYCSPLEAIWDWKQQELYEFQEMCRDCTKYRLSLH